MTALLGGLMIALASLAVWPGCGGGDDPTPTVPSGPSTATEYVERGWTRFEAGDYAAAESDFDAAVMLTPGLGEAYAGRGWAQLAQAVSPSLMLTAVGSFSSAVVRGENGAYVLAGRAAANLGAGSGALENAPTDAEAALDADPDFAFAHRAGFDADDVLLIAAFARAAQGNLTAALADADRVLASGIVKADPASWQVDGLVYPGFNGAVMAHLHKVSGQFAG